mmetsp:Transcript_115682/g.332284  ORF Transcript_115682/g.332284 Transcript_115682/m.332284 type:complete len:151 (+) Transcript_115682:144-596(+)
MSVFNPSSFSHGHTPLGFYGHRTPLETPGPGAYDPFPLLNPPGFSTNRHSAMPDRSPGYRMVKTTGPLTWRPEPMSLSRLQSEQPLINYASATFWDWPTQRRRTTPTSGKRADASAPRRGSHGSAMGEAAGALPTIAQSRSQPVLAVPRM